MKNIKYILTDLDGVVRLYPQDRDIKIHNKYSLSPDAISLAAFEKNLLIQVICGQMTDEQWRSEIILRLAETHPAAIAEAAVHEWSNFPGIVDHRYLKFLKSRFADIPVAVLTNATSKLTSDLALLGLQDQFMKIFNSSEIGLCKPDEKIFSHVVNSLDCQSSEILFVDDSASHVLAAEKFGMQVHHYKSYEEFQTAYS